MLKTIFLILVFLGLTACGNNFRGNTDALTGNNDGASAGEPGNQYEALAWEKNDKSTAKWSQYMFDVIENETFTLLDGADDIDIFCPKYDQATKQQKINFWGQLFAAMAKFESNWNPIMRFHESSMGLDPITQLPVFSEGLMQLSYQDTQWEPRCEFNWSVDKNLSLTDPLRTILDPLKNLRCGLLIMEKQIKKHHRIIIDSGVYWAVIRLNGQFQKIAEISAMTKSLSFCK